MIPISSAAPCVEPWDESEDNGGATAQGVTADEILVVLYKGQPDPLQQALVEDAGANTDPDLNNQVQEDYIDLFADVYETYGRTVRVEVLEASGLPDDATAAQADALRAIDFEAVRGGRRPHHGRRGTRRSTTPASSASAAPRPRARRRSPKAPPTCGRPGMTPEQADIHLAEMVGKQLVGKPAEFAGDEAMHTEERVFGWIQAETETGEYKERNDAFEEVLAERVRRRDRDAAFTYLFDPAAGRGHRDHGHRPDEGGGRHHRSSSARIRCIPANITKEATAQNYFPEWVIGPSVLADTTIFGRTFDQEQWAHALGLGAHRRPGPSGSSPTRTSSTTGTTANPRP